MDSAGFFKGDTMMEVFTVLANSGTDVKTVRDAVILYIARKKQKGRSEQHIQDKLLQLEDKFKHVEMWHPAFRDARALFQLPKSKHIPLPKSVIRKQHESKLLHPIDMGSVPSSLKSPASPSHGSPTPSSRDEPLPRLQDLPYVLSAFCWEDESLESRVHIPPSSSEKMISSDVLSLLFQYGDSEGDDEITTFLSKVEQS
ncbi:uncharacterized protein F5147DRAFT_819166 [Suillus discolor]|uniref:Uncharacterized protein n=1 Tax=Suillus discolor TaxID=1912936 RepID=A0A9P7EY45_9AGAM|nr:uncharacterized protein F5147DRAFT_819166 [Suillus discolor]KAG2095473.1 hypothetical protein F5147DRAFT_819166 [Suillus discolor]